MKTNVVFETLLTIGLTEFEAKIYLKLLENSELNVSALSQVFEVHRNKIYQALETLENKGLLSYSKDYSRSIEVEQPSKILSILQEQENQITQTKNSFLEVLPSVLSSYYSSGKQQFIKVYTGQSEFMNLFYKLYSETDQELVFFGNGDMFRSLVSPFFLNTVINVRVQRKIPMRMIDSKKSESLEDAIKRGVKEHRKFKQFPFELKSFGTFHVAGNKVVIWNPVAANAIMIEDKTTSDFFREIFNIIWDLMPEGEREI